MDSVAPTTGFRVTASVMRTLSVPVVKAARASGTPSTVLATTSIASSAPEKVARFPCELLNISHPPRARERPAGAGPPGERNGGITSLWKLRQVNSGCGGIQHSGDAPEAPAPPGEET